ncbi:MAG: winged helix-turn-helix transcriptional regulator [Betaproteobacteria bacterium]|nr:winged helix-turn-helix transcriptional regulator [Betaproteobacteria bacterium]
MERTLTITLRPNGWSALREAAQAGFASNRYAGEYLNFETAAQFFGRLTERRWEIVRALQGAGSLSVREVARRVHRDVKRVHEDLQTLLELGLIETSEGGGVECPYADIHVDMHLGRAEAA